MRSWASALFLSIVFAASACGFAKAPPRENSFQVGSESFPVDQRTSNGTYVVHMWNEKLATDPAEYPLLKAERQLVWSPANAEQGGYNHYTGLISYNGRLFAMWANHQFGEDAPGQRILFSISDKWGHWSQPRELFPAPGPVKKRHEAGIYLAPDRWAIINNTLYAIAYVRKGGDYPIARRIYDNGSLGDPFLLYSVPKNGTLPVYMSDVAPPSVASKLRDWYRANDKISWWSYRYHGGPRKAIDGSKMMETFMYRAKDNTLVLMARNWGTPSNPAHNRLYVSFSKTFGRWSVPSPTDIPDSPTRGDALRLKDGTILLIGTQFAPRFDSGLFQKRDPLTVSVSHDGFHFERTYSIRTGAPETWHIPNVGGRTVGFSYTSSIVEGGYLYTLYSVGKEDIAISRVRLSEIVKPQ